MAVQSPTSSITYAGNNSTATPYAVPFLFLDNTHLKAQARDEGGVVTDVVLTNHSGSGDPNGGTVRTAVAVPPTSSLIIFREIPFTQTTIYQEGGDFPAKSHEAALDKLTMAAQQLQRSIDLQFPQIGLGYRETLSFAANGTFTKGSYPWLRAIRVIAVGGGGGGGGAATTSSSQIAIGGAGGGASVAIRVIGITELLATSVAVTVGTGGAGGTAGNNAGSAGGNSSFGTDVVGQGGLGGGGGAAQSAPAIVDGAAQQASGTGQYIYSGTAGQPAIAAGVAHVVAATSGASILSSGRTPASTATGAAGLAGYIYGGGGTAGQNAENQASARAGGAGAAGVVFVELFA
jgi:hypothetical protein